MIDRLRRLWESFMAPSGARIALAVAVFGWLILSAQLFFFAVKQPIYSPIDEVDHFFYIDHLYYDHEPPVVGKTTFFTTTDPTVPPGRSVYPGTFGEAYHEATEGIQAWGYYVLMLPVFATGKHGTAEQIIRIRLVTAAMASLVIPLTFLLAKLAVPHTPWVWGAAAVPPALSRGYTFNMSQVTNDPFAILIGAVASLTLLWLARARLDWRWGAAAGTIAGLATVAKSTIYFVPIAFGMTFVVRALREKLPAGWKSAAATGLLLGGFFLVPWLVWNLTQYGWIAPRSDFEHLPDLLLQYRNLPLWRTVELWIVSGSLKWWIGEVLAPRPPIWLVALGQLGLLICLYGLVRGRIWQNAATRSLSLVAAFAAAGFIWLMAVALAVGIPIIVGRYAYPLFPALAVSMAAGAASLGRFGRELFAASALLLAVATVIGLCNTAQWLGGVYHFTFSCP